MSAGNDPVPDAEVSDDVSKAFRRAAMAFGTSPNGYPIPADLSAAEALPAMRVQAALRAEYRRVMNKADELQREVDAGRTSPAPPPGYRHQGNQWIDPASFTAEREAHKKAVEERATAEKASMSYRDYLRARAAQQYVDVRDSHGSGTHRALVLRVTPTGLIVRRGDGEVVRVRLPGRS